MFVKIHFNKLFLRNKFKINHGSYDERDHLIIELISDGFHGYGETVAIDYYGLTKELLETAVNNVKVEIETLPDSLTLLQFYKELHRLLPENPFLRCAFDEAFVDLKAKKNNQSIRDLLGVPEIEEIHSSVTIGIGDSEELITKLLDEDWPFYKIKIGSENRKELFDRLNKLGKQWGVDANGGISLGQAQKVIDDLEARGCIYAEQLLPKIESSRLAELNYKSTMLHFADESVVCLNDIKKLENIYDGFVLKLTKCGGITPVLEMINYCKSKNKLLLAGCMTESSIGINHMLNLLPYFDFADLDGAYLLSNDEEITLVDSSEKRTLQSNGYFTKSEI